MRIRITPGANGSWDVEIIPEGTKQTSVGVLCAKRIAAIVARLRIGLELIA
jgi:hypothetical protein